MAGYSFAELFHSAGLHRLDTQFLATLDNELRNKLLAYRQKSIALSALEVSELLLACAIPLENFLINFFDIEEAAALTAAKTISHNPISAFKNYFVLRRAKKNLLKADQLATFTELDQWLLTELKKSPLQTSDKELAIALLSNQYIHVPEKYHLKI